MTTDTLPRRAAAVLLSTLLALSLAACGGDEASEQDLIDTLVEEGATVEEAECFIDAMGPEQVQLIVDNFDAEEAPEGFDEEAMAAAVEECAFIPGS